jgi:hypothetical protein
MDADLDKKKKKMEHDQAVRNKEVALFNALISVATAVASALGAGPGVGIVLSIITAALGAIQIGYILSQKVPEAARGRYSVIGQDDNKLYKDVPLVNSPETGLYSTPTLISETGQEIVIDPKTTKNLMVNYPHVIDAINFARVPQRAVGLYPFESHQKQAATQQITVQFDPETLAEMKNFREQIAKPLSSNIVYQDIRKSIDTVAAIEKSVTR